MRKKINSSFNYTSSYLDVAGSVIDGTLHTEIKKRADLQIIAHRVPKQFELYIKHK